MDMKLGMVVFVIGLAGMVGGWAAYLVSDRTGDGNSTRSVVRFLVLGVIAAATVPLFLSLVRSDVTRAMLAPTSGKNASDLAVFYEAYLIFAGICVVAAFSARRFLEGVSGQILDRLKQVEKDTDQAKTEASEAKETAQEVAGEVESIDAPESPAPEVEEPEAQISSTRITWGSLEPAERNILQAMATRTYRTRTGIAKDAGIPVKDISELLDSLHEKKLALPTTSPSSGGARWTISNRGRNLLSG